MFTLYTAQKEESCNIYVHSVHSEETTRVFTYKQHVQITRWIYGSDEYDRTNLRIGWVWSYEFMNRMSMIERSIEFTDEYDQTDQIYESDEYDRTDRIYETRNLFIFNLLMPQS